MTPADSSESQKEESIVEQTQLPQSEEKERLTQEQVVSDASIGEKEDAQSVAVQVETNNGVVAPAEEVVKSSVLDDLLLAVDSASDVKQQEAPAEEKASKEDEAIDAKVMQAAIRGLARSLLGKEAVAAGKDVDMVALARALLSYQRPEPSARTLDGSAAEGQSDSGPSAKRAHVETEVVTAPVVAVPPAATAPSIQQATVPVPVDPIAAPLASQRTAPAPAATVPSPAAPVTAPVAPVTTVIDDDDEEDDDPFADALSKFAAQKAAAKAPTPSKARPAVAQVQPQSKRPPGVAIQGR